MQDLIWAARRHFALSSKKMSMAVEGGEKGDITLDVAAVDDGDEERAVVFRKMSWIR